MKTKTSSEKIVEKSNLFNKEAQEMGKQLTEFIMQNADKELEEFRPKGMVPKDCVTDVPYEFWYDQIINGQDNEVFAFDSMQRAWCYAKISVVIADYHKNGDVRRFRFYFSARSLPNVCNPAVYKLTYSDGSEGQP